MEKRYTLAIIILLITSIGIAQTKINATSIKINNIEVIGKNITNVINILGQPIKIQKSFSEMDEVDMFIYSYNGLILYVKNNLIDDFEISNNTYTFSNNIKVGDDIYKLENFYPDKLFKN